MEEDSNPIQKASAVLLKCLVPFRQPSTVKQPKEPISNRSLPRGCFKYGTQKKQTGR